MSDSYDSIRTTDHHFRVPLLDEASAMHSVDALIRLDMMDTVLARGIPGLASLMVADGRRDGTLLTSVCGSDPPDFLDTGDPELCFQVQKLRNCFWTMDFACDSDPGPDLSVREFGRPLVGLCGAFPPAAGPLLGDAGCSDLLCWGMSPSDVPGISSGPGGMGLYKCWSGERDAISESAGDRVASLRVSCLSCD